MSRRPATLHVEIVDVDAQGLGVASAEARTVRVKGALPGECLDVRVVGKRRGELVSVPERWAVRSEARVDPACPWFHRCGGCTLQHQSREAQLTLKEAHLFACLSAHKVVPCRIRPPVAGAGLFYRRKARLGVRYLTRRDVPELLVGFRESFGSRVARVDRCVVLAQPFADLLAPLKDTLATLSEPGMIPQVEIAAGDDDVQIIIRHLVALTDADIRALRAFETRSGAGVLLQSAGYDSLVTLDGTQPAPLSYRLERHGVCLEFHAPDFVQVNAEINELLIDHVMCGLSLNAGDRVLELFSGLGNFSLPMARRGAIIHGLEGDRDLVTRARQNATLNNLAQRARFSVADLYDAGLDLDGEAFDKVLVDPPRSGCGPALPALSRVGFERLVYVSCHPESFAADARVLVDAGYQLKDVGVFDMFPHTSHVETLGVFAPPG